MKNLFVVCSFLLLPWLADAQQYSEVVTVDSANAEKLFSRAKVYVTNAFKSGKDVTQLMDDADKTIIAKGIMDVKPHNLGWKESNVSFKLTIACKDGRYKYSFEDLVFNYQAGLVVKRMQTSWNEETARGITKKQWEKVKDQTNEIIAAMISDLKKQMSKSDDW